MKEWTPLDIQIQNDQGQVLIKWADGHTSTMAIQRLRGYCPCAQCQGHQADMKWQENQTHVIFEASLVGRYAINFKFGDGHHTGIFRFESLRQSPMYRSEDARS